MTHNRDDAVACAEYLTVSKALSGNVRELSETLNIGPDSRIDTDGLSRVCRELRGQVSETDLFRDARDFVSAFLDDFERIVSAIASESLETIEQEIGRAKHIFKGPHGLVHDLFCRLPGLRFVGCQLMPNAYSPIAVPSPRCS